MIFSNIIYKIGSGKNITIYSTNSNELEIYSFNKSMQKITFSLDSTISTLKTININYDYIEQINDNLFAVGYDKNISVINEL